MLAPFALRRRPVTGVVSVAGENALIPRGSATANMQPITRVLCSVAFLLVCTLYYSAPAQAGSVITVNCSSSVHLADFVNCAEGALTAHSTEAASILNSSGSVTYVTFSPTKYTIVVIEATIKTCEGHTVCLWNFNSVVTLQSSGAAATSDADLGTVDASILAATKANISPLNIDPDQVYSLINVEFPEILTNQIDAGLLSALGPGYVYATPIGTTVMVTCTGDGTNAQFIRISMTGSVQWEMVPGTLKNKAGQFIDSKGNVIAPPINKLSSANILSILPDFPGYGLVAGDWNFWSPEPQGTVTIEPICASTSELGCEE
jgi:hypothetical protein